MAAGQTVVISSIELFNGGIRTESGANVDSKDDLLLSSPPLR